MAIRIIREDGDEVLRKKSKEVLEINDKIKELVQDMIETMRDAGGIGLAAPQVGLLKRIIVIETDGMLLELINPKIIKESGSQTGPEGCLSIPGFYGEVERPKKVVVEALNLDGEKVEIEGKDMLARVICHEIDHLDGILFKDIVIGEMEKVELN